MNIREKFEAWVIESNADYEMPEVLIERNASGDYSSVRIQGAWDGYQAAKLAEKPTAWMRKWAFDGERPVKTKNGNGRLSWGKFRILPVTQAQCMKDDVPLFLAVV